MLASSKNLVRLRVSARSLLSTSRRFSLFSRSQTAATATASITSTAMPVTSSIEEEKAQRVLSKAMYAANHRPLAVSKLLPYGPPYTNTAELASAHSKAIHHQEQDAIDHLSTSVMKVLRVFVHAFFRDRYLHHALVLETVAGVPGLVAGMFRHFRSLRRMERDNGKIGTLLEEAENERMHLLIWLEVTKPTLLERLLVLAAQGAWSTFYAVAYVCSPRFCHRLVGYLEQEAFHQYTLMIRAIDEGRIANGPAPDIARVYYNLPPDATLRDVAICVRADEAAHRDFNHELSDDMKNGFK